MLTALRKHLTPGTLIAALAFVFALTGGAFAAGNHGGSAPAASASRAHATSVWSNAKAGSGVSPQSSVALKATAASKGKAKHKTSVRGPAGPKGATGPAGPAGAAGATGPPGPAGQQGPAGSPGETGKEGPAGKNGTNGKNGVAGVAGTPGVIHPGEKLPTGASETGAWSTFYTATAAGQPGSSPISFTIPLAAEPEPHYYKVGETPAPGSGCKGEAEKPEAEPGNLCVFAEREVDLEEYAFQGLHVHLLAPSPEGAVVVVSAVAPGEVSGLGTWAVTG